jgi:DNA replication initiation complex subunit (GINS family)
MDLKKGYEKLYQHWLSEFQNTDLTELSQDLFDNYKKFLDFINKYQEEGRDEIKDHIFKSYKDNLNYLFKDFLKIRELKIINSALALKEIKLDNILETEKLLYENLVSSIKGYRKVKAFSLYEVDEVPFVKSIELRADIKNTVEEVPISKEEQDLLISDFIKKADQEQINYTLVRFLKSTPPLVGVDLISYGPFEKEDIANLPQKNAKILIIEKFAEKIEIQ